MSKPNSSFFLRWLGAVWGRLLPKRNGHVSSLRIFTLAFVVLAVAEIGIHALLPAESLQAGTGIDLFLAVVVVFPILYLMVHRPMAAERRRAQERNEFHLLTSRSLRILNSARDSRVLISSVLPRIRLKLGIHLAGVCRKGEPKIYWSDASPSAQGILAWDEGPIQPNPNPICGGGDCLPMYDLAMFLEDGDAYDAPAKMTARGSVWWSTNQALKRSLQFVRGNGSIQRQRHKCRLESLAIVPVFSNQGVHEYLIFGDPKPHAFNRDRIHMLEWIANGLEMAVARWESEAKLNEMVKSLETSQALGRLGSFEFNSTGEGHFSDELLRILGMELRAPRANLDSLLESIHINDRHRMEQVFAQARVKNGSYDEEFRIVQPGGEVRHIHGVGGYRSENGNGYAIHQGVFQDVTARLKVEEERSRLENRISHKHSLEIIGKLAGGVAHDFNNILTSVLCNAEILIDTFEHGVPSKNLAIEHLNSIQNSASRASRLTRQLLMFGRKQCTREEEIVLPDLIHEMVRMFRRLLPENIRISTAASAEIRAVKGDPGMVEQVLLNLVLNARDSMPEGGRLMIDVCNVEISPEQAKRYLDVDAGSFVLLSVSDTGCGMDEETLARAFQPFFTTKAPGKGTGLGLAMVEESVQKMRGFVHAKSHLGLGTIFQIYLPAMAAAASRKRPRPVLVSSDEPNGEGILVCEDDDGILELTVTMLERAGYTVFAANDGNEALKLAQLHAHEIRLLITDVIMPGMSGRDVSRRLHQQIPLLRTLYISGYTEDVLADHGIRSDSGAFLGKPFSSAELLQNVRKVLKRA